LKRGRSGEGLGPERGGYPTAEALESGQEGCKPMKSATERKETCGMIPKKKRRGREKRDYSFPEQGSAFFLENQGKQVREKKGTSPVWGGPGSRERRG